MRSILFRLLCRKPLQLVCAIITIVANVGYAQDIGAFDPYEFRAKYDRSFRQRTEHETKHETINPVVFQSKGKYGLKDSISDRVVLKPSYDKISNFINGYAICQKDGKEGIITSAGKQYIKPKYREIKFPPVEILKNFINPVFIVSEKGDGKYKLISKENSKGDLYSHIIFSPSSDFYGEVAEGTWTRIHYPSLKSQGDTFKASKEDMSICKLSDEYSLFNKEIYKYDNSQKCIVNCTPEVFKNNTSSKKITLSGIPFLYCGNALMDLSSFPDYKLFQREINSNKGEKKSIETADGIYIEIKNKYHSPIPVYLVNNNRICQIELPTECDSRYFAGILALKDVENNNMGLFAKDKIILPATFSKVHIDRHLKGDSPFILCRAFGDTQSESSEVYENACKILKEVAGDNVALYVRTPNISCLYGWCDKPINIEGCDELIIENNFIWCRSEGKGETAYDSDGMSVISGISGHESLDENLFRVFLNGKVGLVKFSDGKMVTILPTDYDKIWRNDEIRYKNSPDIIFERDKKKGLIAEDGTEILPCSYDKIEKLWQLMQDIKPIIFKVTDNGRTGLIGIDGKMILPCRYADISSSYDDDDKTLIEAKDFQGNITVCDANGKVLIPAGKFDSFGIGGRVYKNGKMGFINTYTKELIIPCKYDRDALDGGIYGPNKGKDTRIALGYENNNGTATVDIWTFAGKKLATKTFPANAIYSMALFIEQWLGVSVGW